MISFEAFRTMTNACAKKFLYFLLFDKWAIVSRKSSHFLFSFHKVLFRKLYPKEEKNSKRSVLFAKTKLYTFSVARFRRSF